MGLKVDEVRLEKRRPEWREEFEREKLALVEILGELALDIQHVDSTSVPGLDARPIIDIAVGVFSHNRKSYTAAK